jgi:hypothetical protein
MLGDASLSFPLLPEAVPVWLCVTQRLSAEVIMRHPRVFKVLRLARQTRAVFKEHLCDDPLDIFHFWFLSVLV